MTTCICTCKNKNGSTAFPLRRFIRPPMKNINTQNRK